jgi:hypothetical protein
VIERSVNFVDGKIGVYCWNHVANANALWKNAEPLYTTTTNTTTTITTSTILLLLPPPPPPPSPPPSPPAPQYYFFTDKPVK